MVKLSSNKALVPRPDLQLVRAPRSGTDRSTRRLESQRARLEEAGRALETMRAEHADRVERLQRRQRELQTMHRQWRAAALEVMQQKEEDSVTPRFLKTAARMRSERFKYNHQIGQMRWRHQRIAAKRDKIAQRLRRYLPLRDYVFAAMSRSHDFSSVHSLVNRYYSLTLTLRAQRIHNREVTAELQQLTRNWEEDESEAKRHILLLEAQEGELLKRQEDQANANKAEEAAWWQEVYDLEKRETQVRELKQFVRGLYAVVRRYEKKQEEHRSTMAQLAYIERFIHHKTLLITEVKEQVQKQEEKEKEEREATIASFSSL